MPLTLSFIHFLESNDILVKESPLTVIHAVAVVYNTINLLIEKANKAKPSSTNQYLIILNQIIHSFAVSLSAILCENTYVLFLNY